MNDFNREQHWEHIYQNKSLDEVSWYQLTPQTSLDFVKNNNIALTAKIIDVGGGDSFFVDHLLELGYTDVTVLDISASAIKRAKKRLGTLANKVKWIVCDAAKFEPTELYDFWHDRAAFHFLTALQEVESYISTAYKGINKDGILVLGTFSKEGPEKCSGIPIQQYSESSMINVLKSRFKKTNCMLTNHKTPFNTVQQFIFCSFKKCK